MCFIFHQWSKWEQYEHRYQFTPGIIMPKAVQGNIYDGVDLRQRRFCLKCGTMQDRLVSDGVGLSNNACSGLATTSEKSKGSAQTANR